MGPTYWDYLKLDRLLDLQGGVEGDETRLSTDELHFIIVHQAYELWFKLILRELRAARTELAAPRVPEEKIPFVVHHLGRVTEIMKLLVDQFRVMETLTPQDFLAFRDKLIPASGFQSFQLRELEILLGLGDAERIAYAGADPLEHIRSLAQSTPGGRQAWARIEQARSEPTLRSVLHDWLYRTPVQGSGPSEPGDDATVERFVASYFAAFQRANALKTGQLVASLGGDAAAIEARMRDAEAAARRFLFAEDVAEAERARVRRVRAGVLFIESYRELPLLAWPRLLIDSVVELEAQLVIFRSRHARMVERIIGRRVGTGGSSGVDYLDQTARYRVFSELWSVRTLLLAKEHLPPLERAEAYGFAR